MKIGLSLSRCVLDIVEGRVDIEDVLVIIARTDFDPNDDQDWDSIWTGYTTDHGFSVREWADWSDVEGAEDKFRAIILQLWNDGKIHQPRKFGAYPSRRPEFWLEAILPDDELDRNLSAKKAWERFQVIAGLANVKIK